MPIRTQLLKKWMGPDPEKRRIYAPAYYYDPFEISYEMGSEKISHVVNQVRLSQVSVNLST